MRFILLKKPFKRLICVSIIFFSFVVSAQAQTGLIGYWNFDDGTGTTVTDSSGNGFDGEKTGGTWEVSTAFAGAGNALNLAGSYVEVADNVLFNDLQDNMTIEAWVFQTDNTTNTIIDRGTYNFLLQTGDNLSFYNVNLNWTYSAATIATDEWVHVAITWSKSTRTLKFYKNGALVDTFNKNADLNFNGVGKINLGRQDPNTCRCNTMNGKLDEVRLWSVERTAAEISANYNKIITVKTNPTITNFNNVTKLYFDDSYTLTTPTSNSAGAFTYTISDEDVATITGTTVTIVGAGNSTITATQAADDTYSSASITATLTVNSVSVLTKNGGISTTNPNYVNKYGAVGGGFGVDKNGAIITAKTPPATIGDLRAGGVVFWVDPDDNRHGLVCAIEDQSGGIRWYNGSFITTEAIGTAIGTGSTNTTAIIANQGPVATSYAAGLARDYDSGGYTDWFLPSEDELNEMYLNKATINSTAAANSGSNFAIAVYWSSTENDSEGARVQYFGNGYPSNSNKESTVSPVRAVRAF
jgi:hypothetical protein